MTTEQKKNFLIEVAFGLFVLAIIFLLYKYILPVTLPFIIGFIVSWMVVKITNKFNSNNRWLRALITILLYVVVGFFIVMLLIACSTWIIDRIILLPGIFNDIIIPAFTDFHQTTLHPLIDQINPEIHTILNGVLEGILDSLGSIVSNLSDSILNSASNILSSIPNLFISTLMMLISSFFFVVDFERIVSFYEENMTVRIKNIISILGDYLRNTLLVVIRSYLLIMLLTFTELSILFTIFGISYGVPLAIIIAIFDIMPVLGTGGILIPWAILSFAMGNYWMGIKVIIIYGIVTVVRNYVEPKIVGAQLGLHPIITLVSMFIGLRLFGFIGMFGFPITISFVWKNMRKTSEKNE